MLPAIVSTARSTFTGETPLDGGLPSGECAGQDDPQMPASVLTIYSYIRIYASMKINIEDMFAAADQACNLLKALANPHRLAIVCQLSEKRRSVGELANLLKVRGSTVSQHLALLRRDGLVTTQREGQTIWYSIGSAPAREIIRTLYSAYCHPKVECAPAGARRRARPQRGRKLAPGQ
jgi:DNA-binding transcriptional ArsR family regulator